MHGASSIILQSNQTGGSCPVATAATHLIGTSTVTGLACIGLFSLSPRLSASCVDCVTTAMPVEVRVVSARHEGAVVVVDPSWGQALNGVSYRPS